MRSLITLLIATLAFHVYAGPPQMVTEGVEASATHSSGRGIGEFGFQQQGQQQQFDQNGNPVQNQQTQLQQMQQQVLQLQEQGKNLTQKKSSGRGAQDSGQAAQAAQESIKSSTEKQSESLKSAGESFLSSVGSSQPKDAGVSSAVADSLKALSAPAPSGSLTEIAKGVVQDIQALNASQVAYITKVAEQFTAPPRAEPVAQKGTSLANQIAASGLNPSYRPGNIFAEGLRQNSPVQVPQHTGNGFMESRSVSPGVMRGISSETIYNVPAGISLRE